MTLSLHLVYPNAVENAIHPIVVLSILIFYSFPIKEYWLVRGSICYECLYFN